MRLFLTVLLLFTMRTGVMGQYVYQQVDNSHGLSNSIINRMFQDSDNLLWVATLDGLNVYDGAAFHVFNYERPDVKNAIASNIIYQISEDKKHNIWLATAEGVTRYHKPTGKFTNYKLNSSSVLTNGYFLGLDSLGQVYAARVNTGEVSYYDAVQDRFKQIFVEDTKDARISKMAIDQAGKLWLFKNGSLGVYIKKNNGFYKQPGSKTIKDVDNLLYTNHTIFYTNNKLELFRINAAMNVQKVAELPDRVRSMTAFGDHYVFAWLAKGVGEYDNQFRPVFDIINAVPSLNDLKINNLIVGQEQMLWCGTEGNGIIKVFKKTNYFKSLNTGNDSRNMPVNGFAEVNGNIWIATKRNGILCNERGKSEAGLFPLQQILPAYNLPESTIHNIKVTTNGLVYIGSDAAGVYVYDNTQNRFLKWETIAHGKTYPAFGAIHAILTDVDGSVWLGSYAGGLTHLKLKRNGQNQLTIDWLKTYRYTGDERGPGNDVINALEKDNNGNIWIACRFGGLSVFNKQTGRFRTFKASLQAGSLSNNDVLSLFNDQMGKIWIGTSYGLNIVSSAYHGEPAIRFTRINVESGLPNNTVHAIEKDRNGKIWVTTNKGVAHIDPVDRSIMQFTVQDGLQGNEFSDNAIWSSAQGKLYFGGIHGASYFVPRNLPTSRSQSNLVITELKVAGLAKGPAATNIINLKKREQQSVPVYEIGRDENFFELKVNTIQFSNQEKCRYAYLLQGNDIDWHTTGDDKRISYSNLQPGSYILRLKWSNGNGSWNKEVGVFKVVVRQYFWLTWPAFLVYAVLVGIGAYLFHLYRKNKLNNEHKLAMNQALRQKDEEQHRDQLDYFTNIAHELQTPLTIISGTLERYFKKETVSTVQGDNTNLLYTVNEQSSRLNYLVYQLLEFRKAEDGHLSNHYSYINVSDLLINITELFTPLAEQKTIDLACYAEPGIMMWTDKDKLEKIIFNLISNAIKHTGSNQHVVCKLDVPDRDGMLEMVFTNSGCTLQESALQNLFKKFFVADTSQQSKISTGLGLAFTAQLTSLLDGNIKVDIKDGWITFRVIFNTRFVPEKSQIAEVDIDKTETPSYLLSSIINKNTALAQGNSELNNKQALLEQLGGAGKQSILIVEDEPAIRFLLNDILKDTYIVYEAGNGKDALEVLERSLPNLIVSDIMMPDMTGLELCNRVKNLSHTCHIPFLILSARGTMDQQTEGYEAGADAYIPKPFNSDHLLVRIKRLLAYHAKLHEFFGRDSVGQLPITGMKDDDRDFLEKTIKLIEANLEQEQLDSQFLEKELGMSRAYFYRRLKMLSSMTPGELIKKLRLQHAATLLQSTNLTVAEIFYRSGFNNQSHFFREFKKLYNLSPNDYRLQFKLA